MKRFISMILVLAMCAAVLAGCSGGTTASSASSASSGGASSSAAPSQAPSQAAEPAGKVIEINFAIHTNEGTNEFYSIERFKQTVEEKTGGQIQVHLFPGASLGTEMENLEQVKIGEVQMSIFGDNLTSQLAPELDPTVVPFIYPSAQEVFDTWNGPLGEMIRQALEERGNQILVGLQERGARKLTANVMVQSPTDLKNIKLRIPEIASWVTVWQGLGAMPTPVAWSETYSALQTKVVDAQENPLENIYVAKIYEVQEYTILTDHLYNVFHWTINKDFFNSLSGEYQTIILEAAEEACRWGDTQLAAREAEVRAELEAEGHTFVEVDRQLFIDAARPYVEEVAKTWDQAARDEIAKFYN